MRRVNSRNSGNVISLHNTGGLNSVLEGDNDANKLNSIRNLFSKYVSEHSTKLRSFWNRFQDLTNWVEDLYYRDVLKTARYPRNERENKTMATWRDVYNKFELLDMQERLKEVKDVYSKTKEVVSVAVNRLMKTAMTC